MNREQKDAWPLHIGRALRVASDTRAALVGAGGKTTALFQLARSLEGPVLVTASTHLGAWQLEFADRHWIVTRPEDVIRFAGQVEGVTLFIGPAGENERMQGLSSESLNAVGEMADQLGFPVLMEADGSRQHPLKAPGENEPVIPDWINLVVVTAGLSGLGSALD
jgi:molybdenum cofactor cytidylyltransferase